jgi:hypothetical protein
MDSIQDQKSRDPELLKRFDAAFGQFCKREPVTVTCDKCNGKIVIEALGAEAWKMKCPCGRFNGTMRGL